MDQNKNMVNRRFIENKTLYTLQILYDYRFYIPLNVLIKVLLAVK